MKRCSGGAFPALLTTLLAGCNQGTGVATPTQPTEHPKALTATANPVAVQTLNHTPRIVLKTTPAASDGIVQTTALVKFNLCDSADPDQEDRLNWQFHFGDSGTPAFGPDGKFDADFAHFCRTEHTYQPGTYTATFSVTDRHLSDQGSGVSARARSTKTLTVIASGKPEPSEPSPPTCSAGGVLLDGACWYYGTLGESCDNVCAARGGVISGCFDWGQCGNLSGCVARLEALGQPGGPLPDAEAGSCWRSLGCLYQSRRMRCGNAPDSTASDGTVRRVCACSN